MYTLYVYICIYIFEYEYLLFDIKKGVRFFHLFFLFLRLGTFFFSESNSVCRILSYPGFTAIPLNGQMSQNKRLSSLNKFKAKSRSILIATDVASRGLDIPHVDVVINFDIPTHSKDYIHRSVRFRLFL